MSLIEITDIDSGKTFQINKDQIQYIITLEDGTFVVGMIGMSFHIKENLNPPVTA